MTINKQETSDKVLNTLNSEWQGIVQIINKSGIPYYVSMQVIQDLIRLGLVEIKEGYNSRKYRKKSETSDPGVVSRANLTIVDGGQHEIFSD